MKACDSVCQILELTYLIGHRNACLQLWRFATWKFIYKGFTAFVLFHLLFCLVGSSLFYSWWSWLKVCQFCLSFQKHQLLVSFVFSFLFFLTSSFVIFIISFLLLTLGFIILFLILLGGTLGFSFFLKKAYISMKFPLKMLLVHPIDFEKLYCHFHLSWGIF